MKKIKFLSAAVLFILAAASCTKEVNDDSVGPVGNSTVRTTISAKLVSSKTALGPKEGTAWPNYWKAGDKISVNGVTSDALPTEGDGLTQADFTFTGELSAPFYAAYPASAVSGYSAGAATLTVPAVQTFAEGTYDPAAFIMGGKNDNKAVTLTPQVSIIHLTLEGAASICKIRLTGASGAALSGSFSTNFVDTFTPEATSNVVTLKASEPKALPADFFIAVPAGLSGSLNVKLFDSEGGAMTKNATIKSALAPGQVYSPAALAYTASYNPVITAEGITSSTAIICWDNCGDSHCPAYTIGVYSDAGCTSPVDSYAVPAGSTCWGNNDPRFCISGLTPATTYYVKVTNVAKSADSNILPVTTAAFDIVQASDDPADVDEVILAEDFGELRWDSELINGGVGYFATSQDDFSNSEVSQFLPIDTNSEKTLGSQTIALTPSRLAHWAQGANNNLYIHPGYIKLVGQSKVTHLVTPALNSIPDGKTATLEVEVTASPYLSGSSATFATFDAIIAVQHEDLNELTSETKTNTLDLTSNVQPITLDEALAWKTYKVTINGVVKGDRLAFGAAKSVSGNNARMNISDMKVTIKALYDPDGLAASVKSVSSSTATFTWTHAGSASQDVAKPYRISLYSDSGCENLVVSHEIEAGASCWNSKIPCFIIGGLQPATTYWFIAEDTESGATSEAVSATTEDFTPVDATTVTDAQIGDVILAEDFSEIGWGSDDIGYAAGYVPLTKNMTIPSGINPEGQFVLYNNTGSRFFGSGVNLEDSRLSHGWGFFGNSSVYLHNAYSRVGASGGRTHIVTPALSGIPQGKLATIEVTVTATKYDSSIDIAVFAEKDLTLNPVTDPSSSSYRKYTGASLSDGHVFGITKSKDWETKSVSISNVDSEHQLIIGSLEDHDKKNRFYISDVKVKITDLIDDPTRKIKDAASLIEFANDVNAGEVDLAAIVTKDITVSAEEADTFNSIVDFAGTLDGNGKTITGLTKPLFDDLKGSVADLTLNSTLNITADQLDLGILANVLSGTADGCTTQGSVIFNVAGGVTGEHHIAGMIGQSLEGSSITNCTNEASVTNETSYAGGNGSELMVGHIPRVE